MTAVLNPIDEGRLRQVFRSALPFPFVCIDGFLDERLAREIVRAYPSFEEAFEVGKTFKAVNEKLKVQVTDPGCFPEPVRLLDEALAAPEFLRTLSAVTGIRDLVADEQLVGGGMHLMARDAHLDVHVDFNFVEERRLHRRLNILVFLNEGWRPEWGGQLELWDRDVKRCWHAFVPAFNRCVVFQTNDISYHGVTKVTCPPGVARRSFAGYYYTTEAPAGWTGETHSTVFKARPHEWAKANILMPGERLQRSARETLRRMKNQILGEGTR